MALITDFIAYLTKSAQMRQLVADGKVKSDVYMPDGMIFPGKPYTPVDNFNRSALLVVTQGEDWDSPLIGHSLTFPTIYIDIWAAPSKDTDGSIKINDTDDLADEIYDAIRPLLHLSFRSPPEEYFEWENTSIVTCDVISGLEGSDVRDGNGARVYRLTLGVQL